MSLNTRPQSFLLSEHLCASIFILFILLFLRIGLFCEVDKTIRATTTIVVLITTDILFVNYPLSSLTRVEPTCLRIKVGEKILHFGRSL